MQPHSQDVQKIDCVYHTGGIQYPKRDLNGNIIYDQKEIVRDYPYTQKMYT